MITGNQKRTPKGGFTVHIGGVPLDPRPSQKVYNHSPDGFAWGFSGSGAAQLALALLLHYTGDSSFALKHYQIFKNVFVAKWPQTFSIRERPIKRWIEQRMGDM